MAFRKSKKFVDGKLYSWAFLSHKQKISKALPNQQWLLKLLTNHPSISKRYHSWCKECFAAADLKFIDTLEPIQMQRNGAFTQDPIANNKWRSEVFTRFCFIYSSMLSANSSYLEQFSSQKRRRLPIAFVACLRLSAQGKKGDKKNYHTKFCAKYMEICLNSFTHARSTTSLKMRKICCRIPQISRLLLNPNDHDLLPRIRVTVNACT